MVSISNSSRRNNANINSGYTLPVLYFTLGAIFMSLFGRMSTLMSISGRMYRNDLDPNAVESALHMPRMNNQDERNFNEIEGGIPEVDSTQQESHLTKELHKKQKQVLVLQEQLDFATQQLQDHQTKIAKYDEALAELYKSRKRYGASESHAQSLNATLSDANDKIEKVKSILRGSKQNND